MNKDETLERMNRIVEAVMIYYNYFIPVHADGKTAAEFLGSNPPAWLSALIEAHREKELPFREARMVEEDSSHFNGMLVSAITQDIIEEGGKSDRAKVVMQIMEELGRDKGRTDELKMREGEQYHRRRGRGVGFLMDEAPAGLAGQEGGDEGDDTEGRMAETPRIIIPFVTIYKVEKKDRVRALLHTYNGRITVHFFGGECTVELEKDEDDGKDNARGWTWSAYCHPANKSELQVGTKLGTVKLDRDRLELSSIVEERHRALRDFTAKLVGPKNIQLVEEMRDAVIDPETGEPATEDMMIEAQAVEMMENREFEQLLEDGLKACATAGIIISSGKKVEKSSAVSPRFITDVLDGYRKNLKVGSKAQAMMKSLLDTVTNYLSLSESPSSNPLFETTVASSAVAFLIMSRAARDGAKRAEITLRRILELEPTTDDALPPLVAYLEKLAGEEKGALTDEKTNA